ncbi:MAG: DUF1549 and DUF1553 domain-containing protein [Bryobacteraceae bacterium]
MNVAKSVALGFAVCLLASAWVDKQVASVLARRNFWSFQMPVRPEPPAITGVRNPIDAFLLDALKAKGLEPSPHAGRETLLRRTYLDVTGLPPTLAEADAFLRDRRPDAFERLVERLMSSPHYGERWAQRWLDVARYADTNGYEGDGERPHAWRYRDYVVRSFNAGKPYDRFVREQIAGDELYPGDPEALIATGFNRLGPIHIVSGNVEEEMTRQEVLTEMTYGVGSVFLGLTVGCARCHNHKFDPILQSDYYQLQAIFAGTIGKDVETASAEEKAAHERAMKEHEERLKPVKDKIAEIEKPYRDRLKAAKVARLDPSLRAALDVPKDKRNEEQKVLAKDAESQIAVSWDELVDALTPEERTRRAGLRAEMHEIERNKPRPLAGAFAVVNMDQPPPPTHILKIGDYQHKLGVVPPGIPVIFSQGAAAEAITTSAKGRRSALANWLTAPDHPLTARVMVNRIWQFRMGAGLVRTPNDFGVLGARPTNPKLLDWLATEFVARGWSIKAIDRLILTSEAYQRSSVDEPARSQADPENQLYWRMNRKRMDAEMLRDHILAAAGTLNPAIGGPAVKVPLDPEVYDLLFTEGERDGLWPVDPDPKNLRRRSLYLLNKRTVRLPMLAAFDQPDAMSSCPARSNSTHALQALTLFNSEFAADQSRAFAARLKRECRSDLRGCAVRNAFRLTLARAPRPNEVKLARDFLRGGGHLEDFCLALLNRNEFVYVP